MPEQVPIIHALLIGINYYQPNPFYKSLKGAVRDINLVETFLKQTLKIPPRVYVSSEQKTTLRLKANPSKAFRLVQNY